MSRSQGGGNAEAERSENGGNTEAIRLCTAGWTRLNRACSASLILTTDLQDLGCDRDAAQSGKLMLVGDTNEGTHLLTVPPHCCPSLSLERIYRAYISIDLQFQQRIWHPQTCPNFLLSFHIALSRYEASRQRVLAKSLSVVVNH